MLTASVLSDLTSAANANVRAGHPATIADLAAGGAPDLILANKATVTVGMLREAHRSLGADRLAVVLALLPQVALRAALTRLDAGRPGIFRMRRPELLCLLLCIAEGGNTWAEADAIVSAPLGGWGGFDLRDISAPAPALPA